MKKKKIKAISIFLIFFLILIINISFYKYRVEKIFEFISFEELFFLLFFLFCGEIFRERETFFIGESCIYILREESMYGKNTADFLN